MRASAAQSEPNTPSAELYINPDDMQWPATERGLSPRGITVTQVPRDARRARGVSHSGAVLTGGGQLSCALHD